MMFCRNVYIGIMPLCLVKLLLEHKADPVLTRSDGKTAALIAREKGHLKTAALIDRYTQKFQP